MVSLDLFQEMGAELLISVDSFREKVRSAKILLLDWDGVFHVGTKTKQKESTFSEIDSMGINMLRFGFYLLNRSQIPIFIITGEDNPTAVHFSKRERIDGVFFGIKDKAHISNYIQDYCQTSLSNAVFIFDDILDLSLASLCGLRLMVGRSANPLLRAFSKKLRYADYFTAHGGDSNAIRECSELMLEAVGLFEQTTKDRISYTTNYQNYLSQRNAINTKCFTYSDSGKLEVIDNL